MFAVVLQFLHGLLTCKGNIAGNALGVCVCVRFVDGFGMLWE